MATPQPSGEQFQQKESALPEHSPVRESLGLGEFLYMPLPEGVTRQMLLDEYQERIRYIPELQGMPPMPPEKE